MTLPPYETLGTFYLGRPIDPATGADRTEPLLYDARDLTTHAVCVGMTGSGKTGLCLSLLEEAAIDGIPAIAIDPKGDLGNLLLAFPDLDAKSFAPWIDRGEAARKGLSIDELAAKTAETWRDGLAQWDQDPERIRRFRDAAEVLIYTPGSESGRPLSVLRSFQAPSPETFADATALRERISASVSGLLGLIGIQADPVRSREHILLSSLFAHAWSAQSDLDLPAIIQGVQKPPFDKVGLFDLETFYPAKERVQLAMALNNLLAAPGFSAWMHGTPLDVQRLLHDEHGKPRISIISIAHLNDAERMFVVTLVLSEIVAWMRRQSGTSSLRAIVYMDEIFGYFPPSAMPPAKLPLLTLMKQARAFGVGVVLATQNPVDLDYKGLANAGTWLIGRLQTERDKLRLMEGLIGAGDDTLDRSALERLLSNLGNRVFLMRNVHEDEPVLFRTRWALSYLRGPLTLQEIAQLTPKQAAAPSPAPESSPPQTTAAAHGAKPIVPADVPEYFMRATASEIEYAAQVLGIVRVHFVDNKLGIDRWESRTYVVPPTEAGKL
ncbi:MAG: ATP-binding protein, partial [Xanthomonadaceae bacterium]|nr:ATP-binding protein [Xanthomonadaceae bacterium]